MVEVVVSTPEPDGTHCTHWMRVTPRIRAAAEGVTGAFTPDETEYVPRRQT